jgi:hypothetical protein
MPDGLPRFCGAPTPLHVEPMFSHLAGSVGRGVTGGNSIDGRTDCRRHASSLATVRVTGALMQPVRAKAAAAKIIRFTMESSQAAETYHESHGRRSERPQRLAPLKLAQARVHIGDFKRVGIYPTLKLGKPHDRIALTELGAAGALHRSQATNSQKRACAPAPCALHTVCRTLCRAHETKKCRLALISLRVYGWSYGEGR